MSEQQQRPEALKPCPFCGRTDLLAFERKPDGGGFLAVKCYGCGTHGPAKLSEDEVEASAMWNRRVSFPPSGEGRNQ